MYFAIIQEFNRLTSILPLVCDEFNKYMCDPSYDDIDEITVNSDPVYTPIEYEPITYTDDPDLPFEALETKESTSKVDGKSQVSVV